jgi:hypothetical protein
MLKRLTTLLKGFPAWLITSDDQGTGRIRVDVSQTGFWEKREFRLNEPIPTTGLVIRVTAPINFVLQLQQLISDDGLIVMRAYTAALGTAGGTWTPSKHYLPNNNMTEGPQYQAQIQVDVGGTFTPTDVLNYREQLRARAASATAQASSVGANAVKERGLPPDTYYLVFTGLGSGDYNLLLEERP